jgi:hypothetical protein
VNDERLREGWYLMSAADLEVELRRYREGTAEPSNAMSLGIDDALRYRDAGNIPDDLGRSLRLVLEVDTIEALRSIDSRRARFEPDHHTSPTWRRPGSKPVNVVPLRSSEVVVEAGESWLDDADMAEMERDWLSDGRVEGLAVPGEYRSFIYKTVLSLRRAGQPVTMDSITDSLERWLAPADVGRIRDAFRAEERD